MPTIFCSPAEATVICRYWMNRLACLESTRLDRALNCGEQQELEAAMDRIREMVELGVMAQEEATCYFNRVLHFLKAEDGNPERIPWGQLLLADFGIYFGLPL